VRGALRRKTIYLAIAVAACLVIFGITAVIAVQTDWFRNYVRQKIIASTEEATGGKVEIGSFRFYVSDLRAVITDFVIHGKEPAGAVPLLRVARVQLDLRILTSIRHALDLTNLGIEKPQANVMVFPDGTTNIPDPKQKRPASNTSALQTVVDLAVGHFQLSNGLLRFNSQKQPFALDANNLRAELWFNLLNRRYTGKMGMDPIYVASGHNTPVHFRLTLPVTLEKDRVVFEDASLTSDASKIAMKGSIENLRNPKMTAHLNGQIALADLKNAGDLPLVVKRRDLPESMELDANAEASGDAIQVTGLRLTLGHSQIEASGALKDPRGASGLKFRVDLALGELGRLANSAAKPDGMLALNGTAKLDAGNRYDVSGNLQARAISFVRGQQRVSGITLNSAVHADPRTIALQGLRLAAWEGEFLGDISLEDLVNYRVSGGLRGLDLQAMEKALGQTPLAYSGTISGSVTASGDIKAKGTNGIVAETKLAIVPGSKGIPVSGKLEANYNGTANTVAVRNSFVGLPHSRLTLDGSLNNRLNIILTSRDLNDLLAATSPPTKSPVVFSGGQTMFTGTVTGSLTTPRITGKIEANRFAVEGRQFDSLSAEVAASESGASLRNGTLARGANTGEGTLAQFSGSVGLHHWKALPRDTVAADVTARSNDLGDLAVLAGHPAVGYSGALTATAHVDGTVGNPRGAVNVRAANGTLDGNAFDQAVVQLNLTDRFVTVPGAFITSGSARVNLTGEFQHPRDSFTAGQIHAHLQSNTVDLAQVRSLQQREPNSAGTLQVDADVNGNLSTVGKQTELLFSRVSADVAGKNLKVDGQAYGDLTATARTNGNTVTYNASSNFAGSNIKVGGNTQLVREYPTTADLTVNRLPVERVLAVAKQRGVPARGNLSGTAHLAGTIANPTGSADLDLANATVYEEPLDHVRARVNYLANTVDISRFEVTQGPGRIDLTGRFDHPANDLKTGSFRFKVESTRIDLANLRNVQKVRPGVGGALQVNASGAGVLRGSEPALQLSSLDANIGATGITVQKNAFGDITLKTNTAAGNRVTFALDSTLAGSTIHGQGSGQLTGDYPLDARVNFSNVTWDRLQPLLGPGSGKPPAFEAATDGVLTVNGPVMKIDQFRGGLQLMRLSLESVPRPGMTKTVGIRNQGPIEVSLDRGTVRIGSAHLTGTQTDIQASGTASLTQQTLNVNVNANANLALLQSLDQDIVSSGAITANATVRGGFQNPQVVGQVQLQRASFNYAPIPNGISNANGLIVLNGNSATVRNLEGETGGGKVTASGFVAFTDQLRFALRARATNVRYRVQPGVSVVSDGDVRLAGNMAASTLTGSLTVAQLTYAPKTDIGAILSRSNTPVQTDSAPSPLLDNMKLDIRVTTSSSLGVQASVAQNLQANADLRIRGTAAQPGVLGRITVTEGELVFFGSSYTINSGSIAFYNPLKIEPVLNVNLETQAKGVDVVLTVTGPIDNMKLSYTSDPPLQFSEIVGLLASGKTPTSDPTLLANQPSQPSQSFEQMGESALVSKAIADPVTNRLQRVFGITQLKIDPAFTSGSQLPTARLTFQQQITSNVTFTYTSALDDPNSTIIRAEWAFNPQYSAVATRDQNGLVSVVLFYKKQFR
jgi:translocation and assembly module TamB